MPVRSSKPVASPVQAFIRNGAAPVDLIAAEAAEDYETVAVSQTAQVLGATGAIGDFLARVIIASSTGTITILDGAVSVLVIPIGAVGIWEIGLKSVSGAWNVTTAAATTCTCVGQFT